jgi:hypothetical protein
MFDKDSSLIWEAYMDLEKFGLDDIRGMEVKIHPNAGANPSDDTFMEWSVFVKKDGSYRRIGMVKNIEISNCIGVINHKDVNAKQRSEGGGAKTPNVYVVGVVKDYDFSPEELDNKLSLNNWTSITYNPHKHPEYLKTDCLPDWWYSDSRFYPVEQGKRSSEEYKKGRADAMEKYKIWEPESEDCIVSRPIGSNESGFKANRCILKQHAVYDKREDYMWIA